MELCAEKQHVLRSLLLRNGIVQLRNRSWEQWGNLCVWGMLSIEQDRERGKGKASLGQRREGARRLSPVTAR